MTTWRLLLGDALVLIGCTEMALSLLGIVRMPSSYAKIHASAKAVVLGVLATLAAAVATLQPSMMARACLVGVFLLLTTPVSAHVLARLVWTRDRDHDG